MTKYKIVCDSWIPEGLNDDDNHFTLNELIAIALQLRYEDWSNGCPNPSHFDLKVIDDNVFTLAGTLVAKEIV